MKSHKYLTLASLIILSLLLTVPTASAATGSIAGMVSEKSTGKPVVGAQVDVIENSHGMNTEILFSENSGIDGKYLISGVAPGTYSVTVTDEGYVAEAKTNISVAADGAAVVDFALQGRK